MWALYLDLQFRPRCDLPQKIGDLVPYPHGQLARRVFAERLAPQLLHNAREQLRVGHCRIHVLAFQNGFKVEPRGQPQRHVS